LRSRPRPKLGCGAKEIRRNTIYFCCTLHVLGPLVCPDLELKSETTKPSRHSGRTHWRGDWHTARPIQTQVSTTGKNVDTHPCLERDSNPRSKPKRASDRAALGRAQTSTSHKISVPNFVHQV
jgi:hypothetical protein